MNSLHNNNNSACLCGNHINPSTLKIKHCWVTHGNWSVGYFTRCTLVMHRLVGSIWFFGVTLINLSSFKKTNDLKNWERNLHKPKELDIYMPSHNWEYYLICLPGARFVSRTGLTSLFFGLTLQSSFLFLGEVETRNSLEHPWTVKPKAMVLCVKSRWRWWLTSLNCLLFLLLRWVLEPLGLQLLPETLHMPWMLMDHYCLKSIEAKSHNSWGADQSLSHLWCSRWREEFLFVYDSWGEECDRWNGFCLYQEVPWEEYLWCTSPLDIRYFSMEATSSITWCELAHLQLVLYFSTYLYLLSI